MGVLQVNANMALDLICLCDVICRCHAQRAASTSTPVFKHLYGWADTGQVKRGWYPDICGFEGPPPPEG